MNNNYFGLLSDPSLETILKNVTVSQKKWSDLVCEILDMSRSTAAAEAENHLLQNGHKLLTLQTKAVVKSAVVVKEDEKKRVVEFIKQHASTSNDSKALLSQPKSTLFNKLLNKLLAEGDMDLCSLLKQTKFVSSNLMTDEDLSTSPPVTDQEVTELDLQLFIQICLEENSLLSRLLILKALIWLTSDQRYHIALEPSTLMNLTTALKYSNILSSSDIVKISDKLKEQDTYKILESKPRMISLQGDNTSIHKYEISDASVAVLSGCNFQLQNPNHPFPFVYFQVMIKKRGVSINGLRIGYSKDDANVNYSSVGCDESSWVLDVSTGSFLHNQTAYTVINLDAKESPTELNEASSGVEDSSWFGSLFEEEGGYDQSSLEKELESKFFREVIDEVIDSVSPETGNMEDLTIENENALLNGASKIAWDKARCIGCLLDKQSGQLHYYVDGNYAGYGKSSMEVDFIQNNLVVPIICGSLGSSCDLNFGHGYFTGLKRVGRDMITRFQSLASLTEEVVVENLLSHSFHKTHRDNVLSIGQEAVKDYIIPRLQNVTKESIKAITIEATIRPSELKKDLIIMVCSSTSSENSFGESGCIVGLEENGVAYLELANENKIKTPTPLIKANEWCHLSIVYNYFRGSGTATVSFYKNGVLFFDTEISSSKAKKVGKLHAKYLSIGYYPGRKSSYWMGSLCNIRIWTNTRSADRIFHHMSRHRVNGNESDLVLFLPLDEGVNAKVNDYSSTRKSSQNYKLQGTYQWISLTPIAEKDLKELVQESSNNYENMNDELESFSALHSIYDALENPKEKLFASILIGFNQAVKKFVDWETNNDTLKLDTDVLKLKTSFPHAKNVLSPTDLNFALLHSILHSTSRVLKDKSPSSPLLYQAWEMVLVVVLELITVNIAVYKSEFSNLEIDCSANIGVHRIYEIFSDMMYFIGSSRLGVSAIDVIKRRAMNVITSNLSFFFKESLSGYRFIIFLAELKQQQQNPNKSSPSLKRVVSHVGEQADSLEFYRSDPVSAILSLDDKSRDYILNELCHMLSSPEEVSKLIQLKFRQILSRDSMLSMLAANKPCSVSANLRNGCLVKRGPDWRYGDEDGGEGTVGVVMNRESWINHKDCGVVVVWSNGYVDKYRYGVPDESKLPMNYFFDIAVVELDSFDQLQLKKQRVLDYTDALEGLVSETQSLSLKRDLLYTPAEVAIGLLNTSQQDAEVNLSITKRGILQYIKDVASIEWQDSKDISYPINKLITTISDLDTCYLYQDFYESFSTKSRLDANKLDYFEVSGVKSVPEMDSFALLDKLTQCLYSFPFSSTATGAQELLKAIQYFVLGCGGNSPQLDKGSALTMQYDRDTFSSEFTDYAGRSFAWNWEEGSWIVKKDDIDDKSNTPSSPVKETTLIHAKILARFTFESHPIADNIQIRTRSKFVDIIVYGEREWSTFLSDMPLQPNTGTYVWYVKIKSIDKKSHLMLGVSTSDFSSEDFIGQDECSWCITENWELYHNGKEFPLKPEGHRITAGSIIEVTLDTNGGTLKFAELQNDEVIVTQELPSEFQNIKQVTVFPAFSMYFPGDSISLVTDPEEIKALRTKFTRLMTNNSNSKHKSQNNSTYIYPGSPPDNVVNFFLVSITKYLTIFKEQTYDRPCLILLLHLLTAFAKWTAPTLTLTDDISIKLVALQRSILQSLDQTNHDSSHNELLLQILVAIASNLNKIVVGLIRYDRLIPYNEIYDKCLSITSTASSENHFHQRKIKLITSLSSVLFHNGARNGEYTVLQHLGQLGLHDVSVDMVCTFISSFDKTHVNIRKLGGKEIDKIVHKQFFANIYHCGLLQLFAQLGGILHDYQNRGETFPSIKPPHCLIKCWEDAERIRILAKDMTADGESYESVAQKLSDRVNFIMEFHPSLTDMEVLDCSHLSNMQDWTYQVNSITKTSRGDELDNILHSIRTFVADSSDSNVLLELARINSVIAQHRKDGIKLAHTIIESFGNHCSGGKALIINRLAMILKGVYCNWVRNDFHLAISEIKVKENGWHYEDGLHAISSDHKKELHNAFSLLVSTLTSELSQTQASNTILQLSLLSALSLRINAVDHVVLSRVNFFSIVQDLIDSLMTEFQMEEDKKVQMRLEKVLSTTIKLFILVGLQIASVEDDSFSLTRMNSSGNPLDAPILQRVKSGPATLNKAVFEIVFKFFSEILKQRQQQEQVAKKDSDFILKESTLLLLCVSKNRECRQILSNSKWIQLLLTLIPLVDETCKQRILHVLTDILPRLNVSDLLFSSDLVENTASSAEAIIVLLMGLLGHSTFSLAYGDTAKERLVNNNFGVNSEIVTLLCTLCKNTEWCQVLTDIVWKLLDQYISSGIIVSNDYFLLLGVFAMLGGGFQALYISCPVIINLSSEHHIGVIKSFHESNDNVEVICYKLSSDGKSSTESTITTHSSNLYPVGKTFFKTSPFSSEVMKLLVKTWLCIHHPSYGSKFTVVGEEDATVHEQVLLFVSLKSLATILSDLGFLSSESMYELLEKEPKAVEILFTILSTSKEATGVGGLQETVLHEQYFIALLSLINSKPSGTIESKDSDASKNISRSSADSNKEDDEASTAMVETLVNMGFPRKLCVLALQICGGDPAEALNYILTNGSALVEMLSASESKAKEAARAQQETDRTSVITTSYHYDPTSRLIHSYYADADLDSERIGGMMPGDEISSLEEKTVNNITWFKASLSDFNNQSFKSSYGEEIKNIFVWVPKVNASGEDVMMVGKCEAEANEDLDEPPAQAIQVNKSYKVIGLNGALVRAGPEISAEELSTLSKGTIVKACEENFNNEGTLRLKIAYPMAGWISKLPGLLERVPDNNVEEVVNLSLDAIGGSIFRNEVQLMFELDDNFEVVTGTEVFAKEERFFGHLQGLDDEFLKDNKVRLQSITNKRARISGSKSYFSAFSSNVSRSQAVTSLTKCCRSLQSLYSRKIIMIILHRAAQMSKMRHSIAVTTPRILWEDHIAPKDLLQIIRYIVFRGDPNNLGGLDTLLAQEDDPHAYIKSSTLIEEHMTEYLKMFLQSSFSKTFLNRLYDLMIDSVAKNIRDACDNKFSDFSWLDASYEEDMDSDLINQPNVHYSIWATQLLLTLQDKTINEQILQVWVLALRGTSMTLKYLSFRVCALIIRQYRNLFSDGYVELVRILSHLIPIDRLMNCASRRLWMEMEDAPSYSRFLQAFLSFLSEISITLNGSAISLSRNPSAPRYADSIVKPVIRLGKVTSHVRFLPQKDVQGPWTLEMWIYRQKFVPEQYEPFLGKAVANNNQTKKSMFGGGSSSSEKKSSLSSLLQLLLGKETEVNSSEGGTSGSTSQTSLSALKEETTSQLQINPEYLFYSAKFNIKLQRGGRIFTDEELKDELQTSDHVHDESYCLSVGPNGGEDKVFDCVVPYERWVHLSIVCDTHPSTISVYLDGELMDAQPISIQFPLAHFGSPKAGQSFCGDMFETRLWNYAKSQLEIRRDMFKNIRKSKAMLVNLRCGGGASEFLYDAKSYITACKPVDCARVEVEDVPDMQNADDVLIEERDFNVSSLFEYRSNSNALHMTGYVTVPSCGIKGPLTSGIREIVSISCDIERIGTEGQITGIIDWVERSAKTKLTGTIQGNSIEIVSFGEDVIAGPPEKLAWMKELRFQSLLENGSMSGICQLKVKVELAGTLDPGSCKVQRSNLPSQVSLTSGDNSAKETLELKFDADEGQYIVFYDVAPFEDGNKSSGNLDVKSSWNGILKNQGSIWQEYVIIANAGNIALGWCTSDALTHPDASVDANDGAWTYSTSGPASHGGNLELCEMVEEGDNVGVHVNTDIGLVQFYRNNQLMVEFHDLNDNLEDEKTENSGLKPFLNLANPGDKVNSMPRKEGAIALTYSEQDVHHRKRVISNIHRGALNGFALIEYQDEFEGPKIVFGPVVNDIANGLFLQIENLGIDEFSQVQIFQMQNWSVLDPVVEFNESEAESLKLSFKSFKVTHVAQFDNIHQTQASTQVSDAPLVSPSSENMISLTIMDTNSDCSIYGVDATKPLQIIFDEFAIRHEAPSSSFIFKCNGVDLNPAHTPSEAELHDNMALSARVRTFSYNDSSIVDDPVAQYYDESDAKYVVQVIYESGATVRNGIEIEDCAAIRTLDHNEMAEAFQKATTSEGIGRFKIADGWISERLRGRVESPVTRLLRERFEETLKFKVVRDEGIKVRRSASLKSDEIGTCPVDTVLSIAERRLVVSSESGTLSWTPRLMIIAPEEWKGWVSEKSHLVQEVADTSPKIDPGIALEIKRRSKVRILRQARKGVEATSKKKLQTASVSGTLQLSSEMPFLLKKGRYSETIRFSSDFTTITCPESCGGRTLVLGSKGFSHGVHYWEVQVKSANWGSVFIGVAPEEASGWNGFGFINYRATQAFGNETLYGTYFGANDRIGILLDMDRGTLSFFKDGEDFNWGRVTVIDMGVAYHNLRKTSARYSSSPMLYPCFGIKCAGDELTIRNTHWISYDGLDTSNNLKRALKCLEIMNDWKESYDSDTLNLKPDVLSHIYTDYVHKCNPDEFFAESRPGFQVTLQCSQQDFEQLLGSEFLTQYQLSVGTEVTTVYGTANILGVTDSRIWYSCERNGKKSWYWLVSELKESLQNGSITIHDTAPMQVSSPSSNNHFMTSNDFDKYLNSSKWTREEDQLLVKVINLISFKLDQHPVKLRIKAIDDYLTEKSILSSKSKEEVFVRYTCLCMLNRAVSICLPLIDLNISENRKAMIRTSIQAFDTSASQISMPSVTRDILFNMKEVIFTSVKSSYWSYAIKETTINTAAPADEYERPEEVKEISVNRIIARNALKKKDQLSFSEKLKLSVFGQVMNHISTWDDRVLRRSYVHMQDAGQARAFFVKFVGEGVDDQGGPYRAVFQSAIGEEIAELLEIVQPCPNAIAEVGENRDKFVFNHKLDLTAQSGLLVHLGRLVGISCRHKILASLSLAPLLWKSLAGEVVGVEDLHAINASLMNSLKYILTAQNIADEQKTELIAQALIDSAKEAGYEQSITPHVTQLMIGKLLNANNVADKQAILAKLVEFIEYLQLTSQTRMLQYFYQGLSAVVPVELMTMFTSEELETVFCGESEFDINVLKKVTVYDGVSATDSHIQFFWQALEELDPSEKSQFINFCSGRSRLPQYASDFPMSFKLTGPPPSSESNPDKYLPIARTCFFSLSVPKYTTYEVCLTKLRYAISNTELMDADFVDRRGTSAWEAVA